jgi:heterodisulfide reductase subunit C
MTTCTISPLLAENIGSGCGENAYKCYQCKRCTSGCPVAPYSEMHPATIMRAVQLGQLDMVFDDRFIWLCTGCETCTARCPQGIDIAAIMDELKIMARRDGRIPAGTPSAAMLKLNYDSFVRWGRMWEVELIARDVLKRPSSVKSWLSLGPRMMLKGKINPTLKRGDTLAMKRMVQTADSITSARMQRQAAEAAPAAATAATGPAAGPADPGGES